MEIEKKKECPSKMIRAHYIILFSVSRSIRIVKAKLTIVDNVRSNTAPTKFFIFYINEKSECGARSVGNKIASEKARGEMTEIRVERARGSLHEEVT